MIGSLFLDPATAGPLWARWWGSARQPARRGFRLRRAPRELGGHPLLWRERRLSPFVVLSSVARADISAQAAPVLLTPPLAGGFAFLLRDVVAALAADRPVHVIEWMNAAHVPAGAGEFGFDDQTRMVMRAADMIGAPAHWIAVCQAGPAALIAAAARAAAPVSITLIGAPIDPLAAPSVTSNLIRSHPRDYYASRLVRRPSGRLVYPAETLRAALYGVLVSQSPTKHELARLIRDNGGFDATSAPFVELVTALMDQPGKLFLDTLDRVYLDPRGPCAGLLVDGRRVDPSRLAETPILAIEGEADMVSAPGQTAAALTLFPGRDGVRREAALIPNTGHFGLFYGPAWRRTIAPLARRFIAEAEAESEAKTETETKTGARSGSPRGGEPGPSSKPERAHPVADGLGDDQP